MDLVPGLVTYQWFTPTVPGNYEILCEELCGTGHFAMRGKVVVDEPAAYQAWLANQPTFAQTQARPVGKRERYVFSRPFLNCRLPLSLDGHAQP